MQTLIFSSEWDLHARAVAWALNRLGMPARIFDITKCPSMKSVSLRPLNPAADSVNLNEYPMREAEQWDFSAVRSVWCRRMMIAPKLFDYSAVHPDDLNNVIADMSANVSGMWHFIAALCGNNVRWLNKISSIERGNSKATQLRIAHDIGFSVPDTLIGNDPDEVRQFCAKHGGNIVMKPFLQKGWMENGDKRLQVTSVISQADLVEDLPILLCPSIFQNLIEKNYELRVVILGDTIIAAKLNSQGHDHLKLDWRLDAYTQQMTIEPYSLPVEIKTKIKTFMRAMELEMGSMDIIVDKNGNYIFLEINEQGQFLFLEKQCPDLKLLKHVTNFIMGNKSTNETAPTITYAEYLLSDDYLAWKKENDEFYAKEIKEVKYTL
jgi:glutathione synthase/RimK-type ligase-like ATP-grasp enzyme